MFRPARHKDLSRCAGVSVGRNKTGVACVGRWSSKAFRKSAIARNADLKKEAKDIMEDANFDTEAHRKGFEFILTELPLQSEVGSEASISGIEELSREERTQVSHQRSARKNRWDKRNVPPTDLSSQKRAGTGTKAHAQVPIAQNTGGSLKENHSGIVRAVVGPVIKRLVLTPDVGHLTASPSATEEPEAVPLRARSKHINTQAAVRYLRDSKLVWPGAMLQRPELEQYSWLTCFPLASAMPMLESFEIKDAVWRDFIPDVPSVFKDSEESLKVLTDRWDSVFQDALLLTFFNPKPSYHLVFFQDTTTGEALAQLPPGPAIDA
ncbi:hypothetical protein FLAG1_11504 [Fusarium langsethiae]|uniref:Uncharacterized protein n=1 Tax=Fusarium langsethiae TaxID=179993 RepID=A0A0M9EMM7_FUSLA|nr:hypothetical protein FLAG1_11504 [Fusarium langsethiae]